MMNTAWRLRTGIFAAELHNRRLYRLEPAFTFTHLGRPMTTRYALVSWGSSGNGRPETAIFSCDERGLMNGWIDLPGSVISGHDDAAAFAAIGYAIREDDAEG